MVTAGQVSRADAVWARGRAWEHWTWLAALPAPISGQHAWRKCCTDGYWLGNVGRLSMHLWVQASPVLWGKTCRWMEYHARMEGEHARDGGVSLSRGGVGYSSMFAVCRLRTQRCLGGE